MLCVVTATISWPLRTDRLVIRPPRTSDLDQLLPLRMHPETNRWYMVTTVDPDRYSRLLLDTAEDPRAWSFVAERDSRIVGTVSLDVNDGMGQGMLDDDKPLPLRRCEGQIGYMVHPDQHGQGYGTEMVRAVLDFAFVRLGLRRVVAGCFADNIGSWRVMEKVGMRREQHGVRDSWHADLGWVDGYTYALLAEEWLSASTDG